MHTLFVEAEGPAALVPLLNLEEPPALQPALQPGRSQSPGAGRDLPRPDDDLPDRDLPDDDLLEHSVREALGLGLGLGLGLRLRLALGLGLGLG